jgi:hypothetical protein
MNLSCLEYGLLYLYQHRKFCRCGVHEQGTRTRLFHVQNREELDLGAMMGQADHVNYYILLITFEG